MANIINGTADSDEIYDTSDDDIIYGRQGNDRIYDSSIGDDIIYAGKGEDRVYVYELAEEAPDEMAIYGGSHDDFLSLYMLNASDVLFDGGSGDDWFDIQRNVGTLTIQTGTGVDALDFSLAYRDDEPEQFGTIIVNDFTPGAGGDKINFIDMIMRSVPWWDGANPFGSGYLSLVQAGDDVTVQYKLDLTDAFTTLMTLKDVDVGDLTADNFQGYAPDGSAPPPQTLDGTKRADPIVGTPGDDTIHGKQGGDGISGFFGDDTIFGGSGNDYLDGNQGDDTLRGRDGDDVLFSYGAETIAVGSDILYGNAGNDVFYIGRQADAPVSRIDAFGGGDDDSLFYYMENASVGRLSGGKGEDVFGLFFNEGPLTITTGGGADVIILDDLRYSEAGTITVTDFTAGAGGDALSLFYFPFQEQPHSAVDRDLFEEGYFQLVQVGDDVTLQYDADGGGDDYVDLIYLEDVLADDITDDNFIYYRGADAAPVTDPSAIASLYQPMDHLLG